MQTISGDSATLRRFDETWGLHDIGHIRGEMLVFVVDDRFTEDDDEPGVEFRVAVSYGDNPFPLDRERGWLEPDPMPGPRCFGVHMIGTRGIRITVFDQWIDGKDATGVEGLEQAESRARSIVDGLSDDEYSELLSLTLDRFRRSRFRPRCPSTTASRCMTSSCE